MIPSDYQNDNEKFIRTRSEHRYKRADINSSHTQVTSPTQLENSYLSQDKLKKYQNEHKKFEYHRTMSRGGSMAHNQDNRMVKTQKNSNSKINEQSDSRIIKQLESAAKSGRILKFADQIIRFPKKERFNQNLEESIKEIKSQMTDTISQHGPRHVSNWISKDLSIANKSAFDTSSKVTISSKGSKMSKQELQNYFKEKQ